MGKILIVLSIILLLVLLLVGAILDKYNPDSNQDCQRYVHYQNGQAVYDYYKCIPVTPVMNN